MKCLPAISTIALASITFFAQAAEPLNISVVTAPETSFGVNATLVTATRRPW